MTRSITIGSMLLLLAGCATRTVFVCPDVPELERPQLPRLAAVADCENLPTLEPDILGTPYRLLEIGGECLTEGTWRIVLARDRMRKAYVEELEAVQRGLRNCQERL